MIDLTNMKDDEKNKFCLMIAEKAKEYIVNKEAKILVESAIQKGWEWIDSKCDISEELYYSLDNEENGFTIFQEHETDEKIIAAWNSIIDAIAFICKNAYLEAGVKYFPEPLELVNDDTIEHMVQSFLLCNGENEEQVNKLYTACSCV